MSSAPERYFVKAFDEETKTIRVSQIGSLLQSISFDKFIRVDLTPTTERYDYYLNGSLSGQVLLTYANASKDDLIQGELL